MRFYNIERSHRFVGKTLVEIKEVDKTYYVKGFSGKILGEIKALEKLNLEVEKGEIFGFLGKNGAGKTTTIKCLMGILSPDYGKIEIDGISIHEFPIDIKQKMGYIPEKIGLYEKLTPEEIVEYLGKFYQIDEKELKQKSKELFEIFGLEKHLEKKIEYLSMGLKKRVALVCALINDPELLVLDEPMSGLDPESTAALRESLLRLNKKGLTIFFSSHLLAEVQKICSRVGIINEGRLIAIDSLSELKKKVNEIGMHLHLKVKKLDRFGNVSGVLNYIDEIEEMEYVKSVKAFPDGDLVRLEIDVEKDISPQITEKLVKNKIQVYSITPKEATLEDIFLLETESDND